MENPNNNIGHGEKQQESTPAQRIRDLLSQAEKNLEPLTAPKNQNELETKEIRTDRYYLPFLRVGTKIHLPLGSQPPVIEIVPEDDFGDLNEGRMAFSFLQSIWKSTWTDEYKKKIIELNSDIFNY